MAGFIQNIKENIGWWMLKNSMKKLQRDSKFQNYSTAKSVGIIFNATHQETYETARKYIDGLNKQGLKVKALGFVDSKELLDFYQKSIYFEYFSRKNLNWFSKPNNPNTQEFIDTSFDILIDLSIIEDFPIQYIVGLSKAKFKVGCHKTSENFYDFIINLDDKKELKYFIEQLDLYLNMIQP